MSFDHSKYQFKVYFCDFFCLRFFCEFNIYNHIPGVPVYSDDLTGTPGIENINPKNQVY